MEKNMLNLPLKTLVQYCGNNNKSYEDIKNELSLVNRENIHTIFKYKKFNNDFSKNVTNYSDGETIIGFIRPCYKEFITNLINILNMKETYETEEDLTNKLLERVKVLKTIKEEKELKKEFPILHNDLIMGRKYFNSIKTEEQRHYYYSCGLRKNLQNFIITQSTMYQRYVEKRNEYKELIEKKNYNKYISENFDIDKLALYITYYYMEMYKKVEDTYTKQQFLNLAKKYLESSYKKDVVLRINNENITVRTIKKQIEEYVEDKEKVVVSWRIIPNINQKVKKEKAPRVTFMNYKEYNRLNEIGKERNEFYENTPYKLKVVEWNSLGYSAYIYPNGYIIMDKDYNPNSPSYMKKNAIYYVKSPDFELLSKFNKKKLKESKVGRIIHSTNWQEKVNKIINEETDEELKDKTKQLIKRLKEKSFN